MPKASETEFISTDVPLVGSEQYSEIILVSASMPDKNHYEIVLQNNGEMERSISVLKVNIDITYIIEGQTYEGQMKGYYDKYSRIAPGETKTYKGEYGQGHFMQIPLESVTNVEIRTIEID